MNQILKARSESRRSEDRRCPKEAEFDKITKAHESMSEQLIGIKESVDRIAGAFVDTDFTRHHSMQKAEIEAEEDAKLLKRHVKHGLALAGAMLIVGFVLMAVWVRVITVSVPSAQVQGATK